MNTLTIKLLSITISGFLSVSCANNNDVSKPEVSTTPEPKIEQANVADKCQRTQRDLSSKWRYREYWCSKSGRVISLQNHRNEQLVNAVNKSIYEIQRVKSDVAATVFDMDKAVADDIIYHGATAPPIKKHLKSLSIEPEHIFFANKQQVLGLRGHNLTLALTENALGSSKITLRGHLLNEEVDSNEATNLERFSVGRSLAVKQLLIKQGVDESKITILHHKPKSQGRYVEVKFHG